MKKSDLIFMSMGNLWRRKLRTVLTLLGVVIGTTSIIVMISLGVGMKQIIDSQLKEMGSLNIVTVTKRYDYQKTPDKDDKNKKKVLLNDEAVEALANIPGVDVASPVKSMPVMLRHGKYYAYTQVTGIKRELMELQHPKLESGEIFSEDERNSFLIGGEIPYQFQDPKSRGVDGDFYMGDMMYSVNGYEEGQQKRPAPKVDVMTDLLLLNPDTRYGEPGISYEDRQTIPRPIKISVSGLLKSGNWSFDFGVYTSLETFDKIEKDYEKWQKKMKQRNPDQQSDTAIKPVDKRKQEYNQVQLFVGDTKKILEIQEIIRKMGYEASSMIQMVEQLNQFTNIAQMVLGGIGSVSLIVAAIGISNTMVMSIYERTKEIGVMKVIGASLEDIQGMFLTEAALIGLIGGIIGLIFSTGGSMLLNVLTKGVNIFGGGGGEAPPLSVIPIWLYLLGMVFTTGVGLISGYLPARRAMRLSVLKALRNE